MISQTSSKQNYKIYKTILQLLQARSYTVPDQKKKMTFEQFAQSQQERSYERELFTKMQTGQQNKIQNIIAIFYNFKKQKINEEYISKIIKGGQNYVKNFFIVASTTGKNGVLNVDKAAQTTINELNRSSGQDSIHIQIFKDQDLMFNILNHDLVPKHMLLNQNQKAQLLRKYKVKETQLPKILLSDPIARFLGLKRGEVVKIERKSQTAGIYTTYRIAV